MTSALFPVVMLPRTGSSLLMQSLDLLGVTPWGDKFRREVPVDANPRGFFEDRGLLLDGLSEVRLAKILALGAPEVAFKVSAKSLVDGPEEDWMRVLESSRKIFLSFRHPTESAKSHVAIGTDYLRELSCQLQVKDFVLVTNALTVYARVYRSLLSRLRSVDICLSEKLVPVPYSLAISRPGDYASRIGSALGRPVNSSLVNGVISNVSSALYRVRSSSEDDAVDRWAEQTGALAVYSELLQVEADFRSRMNSVG